MFGKDTEPKTKDVLEQRRPSNAEAMAHQGNVSNAGLTGAAALTVKQSIYPITLVTILFFLWGFAYGLLDVLNAKFQTALNITAAEAGGLQGAYFGAYFIGPLTYSGVSINHLKTTFRCSSLVANISTCSGLYESSDTNGLSSQDLASTA